MNIETLTATVRKEKGKKVRRQGFVPAVIYGQGIESVPIKLVAADITRVLKKHGNRTRLKLKFDDYEKTGIIKDVDFNPVTSTIQHLDIQIVEKDEKVNWEIPIVYAGRDMLESRNLLLQVDISQIKVSGEANDIPDNIKIDVSDKDINDTVTMADLNLDPNITVFRPSETVLAMVKSNKDNKEEVEEEETEE